MFIPTRRFNSFKNLKITPYTILSPQRSLIKLQKYSDKNTFKSSLQRGFENFTILHISKSSKPILTRRLIQINCNYEDSESKLIFLQRGFDSTSAIYENSLSLLKGSILHILAIKSLQKILSLLKGLML